MSINFILIFINLLLIIIFISLKFVFKQKQENIKNPIIISIVCLLSIFILISILNYDTDKIFEFNISNNYAGLIGAYIAYYLINIFGILSYFIPFLLIYSISGYIFKTKKDFYPVIVSIAIIITLPIIFNIFGFENTGLYGMNVSLFLKKYLGNIGLLFISTSTLLLILLIFSDILFIINKLSSIIQSKINIKKQENIKQEKVKSKTKKYRDKIKDKSPEKEKTKKKQVQIRTTYETKIDYSHLINDSFQKDFLETLEDPPEIKIETNKKQIEIDIETLENKLRSFNVTGKVSNVNIGPVITTYEFEPSPGIKVNKITSLSDDLALAMKAKSIRILGHIPGKSAVGIEIPNKKRLFVYLKNLLTDEKFLNMDDPTAIVIGRNTENIPIFNKISDMPHLLIAGTTGSGKSVCINSIITSILFRAQPEQVRFLMVDPKRIELSVYNGIPHLERPVITETNKAITMLKELIEWMNIRYEEFAKLNVRNIKEYNKKSKNKKPYIIVIIDEMADLMLTSSKEIEHHITRLAQMSRAVGIHLILATQRPSVNIITGSIKANFPVRISFKVPSTADSKTIIDTSGAEKLLGKGDMLFIAPGTSVPQRAHGAFIKTEEVTRIVNLWAKNYMTNLFKNFVKDTEKLSELIIENELVQSIVNPAQTPGTKNRIEQFVNTYSDELEIDKDKLYDILLNIKYHIPIMESEITANLTNETNKEQNNDMDIMFEAAKEYVYMQGKASTSMLQRHFGIGYPRAARIMEQLEQAGIVGPQNGSKPREVYYND